MSFICMSFGTLFCPKLPTHVHWTYPPVAISIWELLEKQGLFPENDNGGPTPRLFFPTFHIASDHSSRLGAAWMCRLSFCCLGRPSCLVNPGDFMSIPVRKVNCGMLRSLNLLNTRCGWCPTCQLILSCLGSDIDKTAKLHCSHH